MLSLTAWFVFDYICVPIVSMVSLTVSCTWNKNARYFWACFATILDMDYFSIWGGQVLGTSWLAAWFMYIPVSTGLALSFSPLLFSLAFSRSLGRPLLHHRYRVMANPSTANEVVPFMSSLVVLLQNVVDLCSGRRKLAHQTMGSQPPPSLKCMIC
jgi:hypothetical protein